MAKPEYFFWVLVGVLLGTLAASFFQFSSVGQAIFLFSAAIAFAAGFFKKAAPLALAAVILAGFSAGVIRGNQYFSSELPDKAMEIPAALAAVKEKFGDSLMKVLPEPEASFASGIILGRSPKFPQDFVEALKRTSTMHLVAVSGYNITIVAANVLRLFELLRIPVLFSWWGAVASIITFTLIVGAPASAVRAAIMGIVLLIGKRIGRESPARLALAFAASLMVLWQPDILRFDLGFQLSFLAAIGIFWLAPIVEEKAFRGRRFFGLSRICSETMGAQLMVAPWILYKFGNLSFLGAAANFAILPIIPFAMFWSFIVGIAGMVSSFAAGLVAPIPYVILLAAVKIIRIADALPLSSFRVEAVSFWVIAAAYAIIAALIVIHRVKHSKGHESVS